ncbi:hypothetical protein VOLCADRAFT_104740 [Volvox carteri f. nagariensis]|uniref:Uncharacterized protein n=1 Tax=Volvox carteri f. nagariensis TaxID=3068 RepID=D8TVS1_VOLCA|nr:uncharacterized protein VOLCADRAFT_104740 [Volvox carteri f. nagariensis]EFJ48352.1 hypothetical protein VOLCADRAFT_104740 [Volvox carteri f. nagariensis]|eukprot:XP_002950606.1 hypothetical protein VOLCADRAFT_104740 [Volvox carteri f. nagariensis]
MHLKLQTCGKMAILRARSLTAVLFLSFTAAHLCNAIRIPPSPPASGFTRYNMVFLGDSLTDQGNAFAMLGAPNPSIYYKGRCTNGPNWVDYLTKTVKQYPQTRIRVQNYAFPGATACPSPLTRAAAPFITDMSDQIAALTADVASKKVRLSGSKTLVFQYLGTNDFLFFFENLQATNGTTTQAEIAQLVRDTITCRVKGAAAIAAIQGVTDIVILPIAPLHTSPAAPPEYRPVFLAIEAFLGNETRAAMEQLNKTLAAAPAGTPGAGVKIWVLGNTDWVSNGAYQVKPPFKYIDTAPCFWNPRPVIVITPGIQVCSDPEDYFFYASTSGATRTVVMPALSSMGALVSSLGKRLVSLSCLGAILSALSEDQVHPTTRFHEWFANKGVLPRLQDLGVLP